MKSDVVFGLLNAGWPVLLVGETGAIQNANAKAVESLGTGVSNGSAALEAFWLPVNHGTPAEFLARAVTTPDTPALLRLKLPTGVTLAFQAYVSSFDEEGKKAFILQLHPEKPVSQETSFAHKQKLDCALQLARTVSLDFNNALTSILGHTSLVLSRLEPDNPWRRSLLEVEKSASKAAEISHDLAAFSRQEKDPKGPQTVSVNQLLERNVESLQVMKLDKTVKWSWNLERKLFSTKFDEAKMLQAFMKLLENAVESLKDQGQITIQTKNVEVTEPTQDRNARLAAGAYVCAEIIDDGCGIEADVLPRIFEPFFTTKRPPHRGLGLPLAYGTVSNVGGGIAVSSQPGQGTSVRVYIPGDKKHMREYLDRAALTGKETILVVDDEDALLNMLHLALSTHGYRVLTANSGHKAIEIISRDEPHIDMLMTDLVMPSMTGRELVQKVRQMAPYIRILCSSGVRPTYEEEDASYLQKPFTTQELLAKVRQVLTAGEAPRVDG